MAFISFGGPCRTLFRQNVRHQLSSFSMSTKSSDNYDAIVVGGGHNGLVAAAYMAKSGLR
jgi:ribulose 1,5-bisphosphate synthetase/thiazole synthase